MPNYRRFLSQAIDSVLDQSQPEWELIIFDDGSAHETSAVVSRYAEQHLVKICVFSHDSPRGLPACANLALAAARGEYIIRLDADDFLDNSVLLVLTSYLDWHPDVGLVYPNYTYVKDRGTPLGIENWKKMGTEAKLLDLPPHGACTMIRKRIINEFLVIP